MSDFEYLAYAATPSRLVARIDEIMRFVTERGYACLHPFKALPYEFFEGGAIGRDRTLVICCRLIEACDEFWVFGVSEGVLVELGHVLRYNSCNAKPKVIRLFVEEFDPEWRAHASGLEARFASELSAIGQLGPSSLPKRDLSDGGEMPKTRSG